MKEKSEPLGLPIHMPSSCLYVCMSIWGETFQGVVLYMNWLFMTFVLKAENRNGYVINLRGGRFSLVTFWKWVLISYSSRFVFDRFRVFWTWESIINWKFYHNLAWQCKRILTSCVVLTFFTIFVFKMLYLHNDEKSSWLQLLFLMISCGISRLLKMGMCGVGRGGLKIRVGRWGGEGRDTATSIEGLHKAIRTYTCTIYPTPWFPFCMARYTEKQQKMLELLIYFIEGIKISTECVCVLIFLSLSCNLVLWHEVNKKVMGHLVMFSNTMPCKEETNMVVASMMTCKIGLIWRHMKTLI